MTLASTAPETYRLHLYVYGKVIQGNRDHRGQIKPGADHRMTGRSAGFPDDLQPYCAPDRFVAHWNGSNTVDGRQMPGGAFLYRPVRVSGRLYGLFARIQSRSELGEGMPGRAYSHCAVLAVEDRWEPALIPAMAELLFDERQPCLGVPNFEGQKNRLDLPVEPVPREAVQALAAAPDDGDTHQAVVLGRRLANWLIQQDLALHGRWLPFALGAKSGVSAYSGNFFAESADAETISFDPPRFTDSRPPVVVQQDGEFDARRFDLEQSGRDRRLIRRPPVMKADNLWPEQGVAPEPEPELADPVEAGRTDVETAVSKLMAEERDWKSDFAVDALQDLEPTLATNAIASPHLGSARGQTLSLYLKSLRFRNVVHQVYVARVDVDFLRAAGQYFHGRLSALSEPHFTEYRIFRDASGHVAYEDMKLCNAIEMIIGLSLRIAVQGDMTEYGDLLARDVLAMPRLPNLGLAAENHGSAYGHMAYALCFYLSNLSASVLAPVKPIDDWLASEGFPSSGLSVAGPEERRKAGDRFDRFAATVLCSVEVDSYTAPGFFGDCFLQWWSALNTHAQDYQSWLFEPTPPPHR